RADERRHDLPALARQRGARAGRGRAAAAAVRRRLRARLRVRNRAAGDRGLGRDRDRADLPRAGGVLVRDAQGDAGADRSRARHARGGDAPRALARAWLASVGRVEPLSELLDLPLRRAQLLGTAAVQLLAALPQGRQLGELDVAALELLDDPLELGLRLLERQGGDHVPLVNPLLRLTVAHRRDDPRGPRGCGCPPWRRHGRARSAVTPLLRPRSERAAGDLDRERRSRRWRLAHELLAGPHDRVAALERRAWRERAQAAVDVVEPRAPPLEREQRCAPQPLVRI